MQHLLFGLFLVFMNTIVLTQQLPATSPILLSSPDPATTSAITLSSIDPSTSSSVPSIITTTNINGSDITSTSTLPVTNPSQVISTTPTVFKVKCYVYTINVVKNEKKNIVEPHQTGCNDKCCMVFDGEKTKHNKLNGTAYGYCGCNSNDAATFDYQCDTDLCNSFETLEDKVLNSASSKFGATTFSMLIFVFSCILGNKILFEVV